MLKVIELLEVIHCIAIVVSRGSVDGSKVVLLKLELLDVNFP